MGIVNVTPDSFSGDGLAGNLERVVARAVQMVRDGADLLDVGGESTRPTARPIAEAEELARVVPAVRAIAAAVSVPISVDTRKASVADAALRAGAHLVNDVTGLQRSPGLAEVVAAHGVPVVVMHSPGESWDVAWPVHFDDVLLEIRRFLERSIERALAAGIAPDQILIDPGFGFGKDLTANLEVLRRLGELRELGRPLVLGTSRKQTIGRLLGLPVEERLEGSLATIPLAIAEGVDVVRVHDVLASVRVARVADAIVRGTLPAGMAP